MFERLRRWRSFRRTRSELSGLDDRILDDIGIGRCQINFYARQHADNC